MLPHLINSDQFIAVTLRFLQYNLNRTVLFFQAIIKEGGVKASVIPAMTTMEFILRAPKEEQLSELTQMVKTCIQSGADATGCSVEVATTVSYKNLVPNKTMAKVYQTSAESFGECFQRIEKIGGVTVRHR